MSKLLPIAAVGLFLGACACGGAYWWHGVAKKRQLFAIRQVQSQITSITSEATTIEQEWTEDRLQRAKAKAEAFRASVLTVAQWDEVAASCIATMPGLRIELAEIAPKEGQPEGSRRVRIVLQVAGIKTGHDTVATLAEVLERLDGAVGGCQRLNLYLPAGRNTQGAIPQGVFAEGSEAVFEFNLRTS